MSSVTYRQTFEVGALLRRRFRAHLDFFDINYVEHKGWLSSTFVVRAPAEKMLALHAFAAELIK